MTKQKTIDLFRGHPTDNLLASTQLLEGTRALLTPATRPEDGDYEIRHPLTYGSDPGAENVREMIANWSLAAHEEQEYGPIDKDSINLTNGASYGALETLRQCTCAYTGYTRQGFIVSPTYHLINAIFKDVGFNGKITAVPETPGVGVDMDFLQSELERLDSLEWNDGGMEAVDKLFGAGDPPRKVYRYAIYCVPSFSNPTGSTMPLDTRKRLLDLARKHDALIMTDDVYDLLDYRPQGSTKLPRMVALDRSTLKSEFGNTVSNCTFSKLLGPGLRVGWQETASPALAQRLFSGGAVRSGGTPAHMSSMIVGELLKTNTVGKVISHLNKVFGERSVVIKDAMKQYLPQGTHIVGGEGGYFFWVTLPEGYSTSKVTEECAKEGVVLAPESAFYVEGDTNTSGRSFRISLSYESADQALKGIQIWGDVCKRLAP